MNQRFQDDGKRWYMFANYFLVECPACRGQATVTPEIDYTSEAFLSTSRKLVCNNCSYFDETMPKSGMTLHIDRDWFFEQPLYLKAACCGNELVAYNIEHLEYLGYLVEGKLRERGKDEKLGWTTNRCGENAGCE